MALEDVVIAYRADISDIKRQVTTLQKQNELLARKLGTDFTKGATVVKNELTRIKTLAKNVDLPLGGVTNQARTFTTVLRGVNGQLATVTRTVAGTGKNVKVLSESVRTGGTVTRSFGENLRTLGKRALLTIPIWFALRGAIFGVFRTIRDGLKNLADFDRALQKLRRNISATSEDVESDFSRVQAVITKFSLQTGKSVEEITNAIQKFATVGFDVETALAGGIASTKLAITLFGEVEGTARAFARSLRVLTEDIDSAEEKQKAIAEALALTDQLWQTNAFEINEFSQNLEKFAGTANIANLSIEDTLTLLATLSTGGLANRAGRLLRTVLLKSLRDIEKVTRLLELDFDPDKQPTIEFLLQLVSKLKDLRSVGDVPVELAKILGDLFSVRSTEVVASLVSLEKTLNENIALRPDLEKFNDTFEEQLKTINRLVERHQNLNKEMGKAFVTGLLGAGNYEKALTLIVQTQETLINDTEKFGQIIRDALLVGGLASAVAFRKQLLGLITLLKQPVVLGAIAGFTVLNFKAEAERLAREAEEAHKTFNDIGNDIIEEINKGLKGKLNLDQIDNLIAQLETFGAENIGFDEGTFDRLLIILKEVRIEEEKISKEQEKQQSQTKRSETLNLKRKEIAELVLESELEILKTQGTLNSELLKTEEILRKQFDIEKSDLDQLKDKLELQREINKEKELDNRLSERTKKLAEIARTDGIQSAVRIGEVLRGELDFDIFERIGGRDLEIFKKEFGDIFKEQQDIKFLQQSGFRIPVALEDEAIIRGDTGRIRTRASLEQRRAELFLRSLENSVNATNTNISSLEQNTRSLNELKTAFERENTLFGSEANRFVSEEANRQLNIQRVARRVSPDQQVLDINVNVDGRSLTLSGTPESIRRLANQVSVEVARAVEDKLVNDLNSNNNAPISQATDGRINNF